MTLFDALIENRRLRAEIRTLQRKNRWLKESREYWRKEASGWKWQATK